MNLFVTGTDTNVGKTFVATRLIRALRRAGLNTVGFKPICCGSREDAEALHAAADGAIGLEEVNPVWLRVAAAPYVAAMTEDHAVDFGAIRETFARLRAAHASIIIEGVGGWRVPITRELFVSDLAAEFGFAVAVVVANRLGALNHTLLTVESVRSRGLTCAGLILNQVARAEGDAHLVAATNRAVLAELAAVPILLEVAFGQEKVLLGIG